APPEDALEQPSAVQGNGREQVEQEQHPVDPEEAGRQHLPAFERGRDGGLDLVIRLLLPDVLFLARRLLDRFERHRLFLDLAPGARYRLSLFGRRRYSGVLGRVAGVMLAVAEPNPLGPLAQTREKRICIGGPGVEGWEKGEGAKDQC